MAFAGDWKGLIILVVCLLLAMWILSFFGISLPAIGAVK
jgi:small neutral amino acid transporter SnatA (MarC family)